MGIDLGLGHDTLELISNMSALNAVSDYVLAGVEAISADRAATAALFDLSRLTEGFEIRGSTLADTITGSAGNDVVEGGIGGDTLIGGGGSDTLNYLHSGKNVVVNLGAGTATGGDALGDIFSGFENVAGSNGADRLTGDANTNVLLGNGGKDTLDGGAGADRLDGGGGLDVASYALSAAGVTVSLALGTAIGGDAEGDTLVSVEGLTGSALDDSLTGNDGINTIYGGLGNDTLTGMGSNDKLVGDKGDDTVDGGDGNDLLGGSDGNDSVSGGAGVDTIVGGAGKDTLTGGADADYFVFKTVAEAGKGDLGDVITDFTSGSDLINLSNIDASKALAGNQAFSFIGEVAFGSHAGELRYEQAAGLLSGDLNGDGKADFTLHLNPGTLLLGADMVL
jgi:Ca2+-binding RTX toxin-like protein